MDEKALEYAFGLFQQDGYTGTLDEYKELIGKDQEAMDYSFDLFSNDGYSGDKDQFSALVMPGKTEPIAPGVAVEETVAPETVNTELQSEAGFLALQETELTTAQSIKNSFSNMFEQLGDVVEFWGADEGQGSALDIATNTVAASIFGQKKIDDYAARTSDYVSGGLGTEVTVEAMKEYEKELAQTKRTKGIIESAKEGDAGGMFAGAVNAVTNALGSIGYTFGTLFTGNVVNYIANNYVEYNKLKAKNLNLEVKDLIKQGKADTAAPISMGILSGVLENIGSRTMAGGAIKGLAGKTSLAGINKKIAEKIFYDKSARRVANIVSTGSTEAVTEILQHASDEINVEFGSVAGTDDSAKVMSTFFDAVTSIDGLEAGLQGFLGGSGLSAGSYSAKALNTVRQTTNLKQIDGLIQELHTLRKNYTGVTDPTAKKGIEQNINTVEQKLSDLIDKGNLIYESLSDEQVSEIESITDLANTAANEITELNKKFRAGAINKTEYATAFNGFKSQYEGARDKLVNLKLEENISLAKEEAAKRGTVVQAFETTEEYAKEYKKLTGKDVANSNGVFLGKGKILINKELARETFSINVGKHELLHNVLNAVVGNATEQRKAVRKLQKAMTVTQRREVNKLLKRKKIKANSSTYYTEYMNGFSDLLATDRVGFDKTAFEKIGGALVSIFKPVGFDNIGFASGQSTYNFIKEYSKAKGPEFANVVQTVAGDINLADVKAFAGSQFNAELQGEVQVLGQVELTPEETQGLSEDQIGKLKDEKWKRKGADDAITDLYAKGTLSRLIGSKITSQDRALPNFKEDDFIMGAIEELIPHIRNFKPSQNDNLSGWINSQLNNKINQAKKTGKIGTKQKFEESLSAITEEGQERFQIESDYLDGASLLEIRAEEETLQKQKINPLEEFYNEEKQIEHYARTVTAINELSEDAYNGLTFADMPDMTPEMTAELFGMKLNAYLGVNKEGKPTSANFSGDKTKAQSFIYNNVDKLIRLLPNGAILEGDTAKENLINTGLKIPRKIQQAFYEQQGRVTLGAGLAPFKLKENITKKDFLATFGISTDGKFADLKNGESRAIAMIAMARVVGRIMSNTSVRVAVDLSLEQKQDLKAGTSIGQFDAAEQDAVNDLRVYDFTKSLIENINALFQSENIKNILDEDGINVDELDIASILLVNKPKGKNAEIDYEKGLEFYKNIREFTKGLDTNITDNKTLLSAIYGTWRDTFLGFPLDKSDYKYLIKDNKKLSFENVEDLKLINNFLNEASTKTRDKAFKNGQAKWVSKYTKKFTKQYKKSLEDNKPKANSNTPNSASKIKTRKNWLIPENFEQDAQKAWDSLSEHNPTNNLLAKVLISTFRDYYHFGPGSKSEKLTSIIISLVSNRNSVNGLRSLSEVVGVVWSPDKVTAYHMEHVESIASIVTSVIKQIIAKPGSDIQFKSTAVLIPKELADLRDSNKESKFSASAFKKILSNFVNNTENNFQYLGEDGQFDKAEVVKGMINRSVPEGKAAFEKISKEDKFEMVEVVTRQMFPESANQPGGSYQSLTTAQRKQVFDRMQEANMVSPEAQFDLREDLSDKISNKSSISATTEISEKKARLLGKNKGKWKFFIPPSADDFAGLMYYMIGKGKQGDKDLAWFKKNLFDPFGKGINDFTTYRQFTMGQFRKMKKLLRGKNVKLKATNSTGFTNEVAVRVYIWATNGHEIPGLSEAEVKEMVNIVSNDSSLRNFASQIINLTSFAETPAPEKSWDGGTLTTDILDYLNTSSREKFLEEYLSNSEEIFGKIGQTGELEGETANRLRAAFGDNYIEALSDVLYRMKTGRRRISGSNKLTNQFINWINDSVGAIMFFNTRSALLQQLSFVNFINFSDNNPLAASSAFINQPQFWSDYVSLFNSDFLKERRSGLKTDVNADEIAKAAEEGRNPIRAVIASLLKKGFLPTQIADSHAIALGGASFYRNRLNRYIKEGMSKEDATKQAFVDFQETAEETQQSSRPDRISLQQASGLGRLVLAFANTPMQYARLTKKAALDLINRRGDWKTNLSKLMYYGAVQNIIFSSLQTALFALAFDDEEEEKTRNRYFRIANGTADGLLRGLGFGGAAVAAGKNMVLEGIRQSKLARPNYEEVAYEALKLSPPISSKIDKLASAGRMFTYRNTREKMKTAGFTLDNPIFESAGKIISATTNLPADRVIRKLDNLSTPVRQDVETWQAVSLALGYSKWDVGLIESKAKKPESSTKGLKKVKRKKLKRKKLN
jgi:hypothetical protein